MGKTKYIFVTGGVLSGVGKGITAFKKGVKDGSQEIEETTEIARDVTPADKDAEKGKV